MQKSTLYRKPDKCMKPVKIPDASEKYVLNFRMDSQNL